MGNHENRAGVGTQIFLKPDEGLQIEVVRGFVEQKKIGFLHQEAGEMGSHDPAAAEGFGLAVEIRIPEGEAAQNLFGAGFELPSAQFGEGVERFVVLRVF